MCRVGLVADRSRFSILRLTPSESEDDQKEQQRKSWRRRESLSGQVFKRGWITWQRRLDANEFLLLVLSPARREHARVGEHQGYPATINNTGTLYAGNRPSHVFRTTAGWNLGSKVQRLLFSFSPKDAGPQSMTPHHYSR
jgi:hypothetical protein